MTDNQPSRTCVLESRLVKVGATCLLLFERCEGDSSLDEEADREDDVDIRDTEDV